MKFTIALAVICLLNTTNLTAQKNRVTKGEIIYHVCQRSFFDSNGDKQGDLNGLRQKLGYLQDLGITSILLLPLISKSGDYNLVTLHRAENTDNLIRLKEIVTALVESKTPIIFPIHPRTRKAMDESGLINLLIKNTLIHVCEPVSYREMLKLMLGAKYILTDSGGVQREAFYLKVPCLTLRNNTGWVETVQCGANKLIEPKDIANELNKISSFPSQINPIFGDGKTSLKIVKHIKKWWLSK